SLTPFLLSLFNSDIFFEKTDPHNKVIINQSLFTPGTCRPVSVVQIDWKPLPFSGRVSSHRQDCPVPPRLLLDAGLKDRVTSDQWRYTWFPDILRFRNGRLPDRGHSLSSRRRELEQWTACRRLPRRSRIPGLPRHGRRGTSPGCT